MIAGVLKVSRKSASSEKKEALGSKDGLADLVPSRTQIFKVLRHETRTCLVNSRLPATL
jgi:hypothetical protein